MNYCKLTKLETELRAALRAMWRNEGNNDQVEILVERYIDTIGDNGPDMYAQLERGERAIFDAEQARAKRQGWRL